MDKKERASFENDKSKIDNLEVANQRNFKYLYNLVNSSEKEIFLDYDIVFEGVINNEEHRIADYSEGGMSSFVSTLNKDASIKIKNDDVVIDGCGHSIDAQNQTQIFNITGKGIVFKNIVFKNAFSNSIGGAILIRHHAEVSFINCKFINNAASRTGGVIDTQFDSSLNISYCEFDSNKSQEGGVINSFSPNLSITNSKFTNNQSSRGGVIVGFENIDISRCIFSGNEAEYGGAIFFSRGELKIEKSQFIGNVAGIGGAISNMHEGKIILNDVCFYENQVVDSGGAIFNSKSSELSIKNSLMEGNKAKSGGCISNNGKLSIASTEMKDNVSEVGAVVASVEGKVLIDDSKICRNASLIQGGAINSERSKITIINTLFKENIAKGMGGAVCTTESTFKVTKTRFFKNSSEYGGSIWSNLDDFKIIDCIFENHAVREIILSNGNINCGGTDFKDNESNCLIANYGEGKLFIDYGNFLNNHTNVSAIYNFGKSCSISHTHFKNNFSKNENSDDILNETSLKLYKPKFADNFPSILNNGYIETMGLSKSDVDNKIVSLGNISMMDEITEKNNFTVLEDLIHNSSDNLVVLNSDFALSNHELNFFEGGIDLDRDDLIIDGNNHIIDGKQRTRIFNVLAKKITLKNITFKNGCLLNDFDKHSNGGGFIKTVMDSKIVLKNCKFIDGHSEDNGGAILNNGTLMSIDNEFINNSSDENGGAIYNRNVLESKDDAFYGNSSLIGGAIYNEKQLTLDNGIILNDNQSNFKEPIYNANSVKTTNFNQNLSELIYDVGLIGNGNDVIRYGVDDEINGKSFSYLKKLIDKSREVILECDITYNPKTDAQINNGIILDVEELTIDGGGHTIDGIDSAALFCFKNINGKICLRNLVFKNLYSNQNSIIKNMSNLKIENCLFLNNRSAANSNLINNNHILTIENSKFHNNISNWESIIKNNHDELSDILRGYGNQIHIMNSQFINNATLNGDGGAILNKINWSINDPPNQVFIKDSYFDSNRSINGRGGVISNEALIEIENSAFINNQSLNRGGVFSNQINGNIEVSDSKFTKNKSNADGICHSFNENVAFKDCTFEGNLPDDEMRFGI